MSEFDFSSQFASLCDTAARLNAESDSINLLIAQLQEKLGALKLGLEVWVPLQIEPGSLPAPVPRGVGSTPDRTWFSARPCSTGRGCRCSICSPDDREGGDICRLCQGC